MIPRRVALLALAAVVLLSGAAAAATAGAEGRGPLPLANTQGMRIKLLAYDNGDASPWAEFFTFDSPSHPKIAQLRREQKLDDIVRDAKTDLERAVRLKRWVAGTLKFGTPGPEVFGDWSAVALLERVHRGQLVWCGQAAMVFQQACLAAGMTARFIELGRPHTPANHFTVEVFLREQGKWAVIDPTPLREFDLYYTVDGLPQSALEMHRHVVRGTMDRVREVHPDRTTKVEGKDGPAWCFYYVRWLTRCDVVTNTPKFVDMENVFDRRWHTVEWTDTETVPWEKQTRAIWWTRNERMSAWTASDPEVVSWKPTDRVRMAVCPNDTKAVFLHLWSADPDFDRFEVSIDGRPWEPLPQGNTTDASGPRFGWGPKRFSVRADDDVHEARARLIRRSGTRGPESFVRFQTD